MDKINEYRIDPKAGEHTIEVPNGSTILSARKSINGRIVIGVWVDLDNFENLVEKTIVVFDTNSEIADGLKANFIGTVHMEAQIAGSGMFEEVYYIFEKLR